MSSSSCSRRGQRARFSPSQPRHVWFPRTRRAWQPAAWPRANPNHSQSKHSAGKRCFLTLPCYWSVSLRAETSSVTEIYTVTTSLIFALPSHFSNSPALRNRGERFGQHHITGMCPSRHVHKVAGLPWRSWK